LWCHILQAHQRTSIVSARFHCKSTIHLGYVAWHIYCKLVLNQGNNPYYEWLYMGYLEDLSIHLLKHLKRFITILPEYFGELKDNTRSEGIIDYSLNDKRFICEPTGILTFKRGRHPNVLICDDILKDPDTKMDISQLKKVERIFIEEVESMPKEEIHVCGTPQDRQDLFAKLEKMPEYYSGKFPAIKSFEEKIVLWDEAYPFDVLMNRRKSYGEKSFNKEFMCRAMRSEEGYVSEMALDKITKPKLKNYSISKKIKLNNYCYAGFDIGKRSHPSHLVILCERRRKFLYGSEPRGYLTQVHSKWMDGWDYKDQLEYIREAINFFGVERLLYDDTRAEFEGFNESGNLPAEMQGVVFTQKSKFKMAAYLDVYISNESLNLISEERQKNQILTVDNDLKAFQSTEGHGDAFFSLCLAVSAYMEVSPQITVF